MRYGARATLHTAKARTDIGQLPASTARSVSPTPHQVSQDDRSLVAFDVTGRTARADHAGDGVDRQPRPRVAKRRSDGGAAIGAGAGLPADVAGSAVDGSGDAARGGIGRHDVVSGCWSS